MIAVSGHWQEEDSAKFYREKAADPALVQFYAAAVVVFATGYWCSPSEDPGIFISFVPVRIMCLLTNTVCFCFE
jgi:hypothetical protein